MTGNRIQDEFLFLFLIIVKRNEISSRVLKNNTLSHTREDEKKGKAMGLFRRIFGKSGPELDSIRFRIKEAEARLLEADSHLESFEHAFYRSVSMFSEYSESSYSEAMVYWDRYPRRRDRVERGSEGAVQTNGGIPPGEWSKVQD